MKNLIFAFSVFGLCFIGFTSSANVPVCVSCDEQTLILCTEVVHKVYENGEWHNVKTSYYGNKSEC